MRSLQNLPGAKAALVAFVLTVLLGVGATSAAGLWQQSATATNDRGVDRYGAHLQ